MQLLTIVSFVFFTGLVGLLTWWITRGDRHDTSDNYFLGGRSLKAGYIAGSLLLTNLSTEQLVGLNGAAFQDGLSVMAWEVIAGLSLVAMALFFLPRYLKSGITTVPQFLEERFDATTRILTSIVFLVAYTGILLPIVLYTGATGLIGILDVQTLLGLPSHQAALWVMVWLVGLIGSVYAIFGGLRTVAVSDTLNGFGLLVGGLVITVLGLYAVDSSGPLAALGKLMEEHPEKFQSLGKQDQSVPATTLFTGVLLINLFYWSTNQQIIQRAFAATSLKEGQKGVLLAGTLKIFAPLILVLPGIIAFHLYAGTDLKNDLAYGTLVRDVLPGWLAGFFAAAMIGAILSSFNSALNSTATLFSLGVYRDLLRPGASDKEVIRAGKICGWVIAILAMSTAPLLVGQTSIFAYLQKMNAIYFIPILAVMIVGLTTRYVPAWAANLSLCLGLIVIALGYFVPQFAVYVDAMNEFHFVGAVFAFLVVLMLAAGAIMPRAEPYEQQDSGKVDLTPWRLATPVGIALMLLVLTLYAAFADVSALAS